MQALDDAETVGHIRMRCVERQAAWQDWEKRGCGWHGSIRTFTRHGTATLELEGCPECGGQLEAIDDTI